MARHKKHPWLENLCYPATYGEHKKRPRESKVQAVIVKYLRLSGWLVIPKRQIPTPGRKFPKSEIGVSDLLCCEPHLGKMVAVEIKRDRTEYDKWRSQNDPTKDSHKRAISQKAFGNEVRKRNGYFYCIYSVEQAIEIVKDLK